MGAPSSFIAATASVLLPMMVLNLPFAVAELTMHLDGRSNSFPTATFRYLGAPPDTTLTNASVVMVPSSSASCDDLLSQHEVRGKVVMMFMNPCSLTDLYINAERSGALGVVFVLPWGLPIGLLNYIRHRINGEKFQRRHSGLVVVEIPEVSPQLHDSWEAARAEDLKLDVYAPHDTTFPELFTSMLWVLLMQVFLPVLALFTSIDAAAEAVRLWALIKTQRQRHRNGGQIGTVSREDNRLNVRAFGFVIAALEAPSSLVMAAFLAFGQYGPMHLPYVWHRSMYFLLPGISMSTTLLLALMIRSERLLFAARNASPRINGASLQKNLKLFVGLSATPLAVDISIIVSFNFAPELFSYSAAITTIFAFFQIAVSIYFSCQAVKLATLLTLVRQIQVGSQIENKLKVQRLVFWLRFTAISMAVNALCLAFLFVGMVGGTADLHYVSWLWFASTFVFALSRIAVMYGQLQITKPGSKSRLDVKAVCRKWLQCDGAWCIFRGRRVAPYSVPHPADSVVSSQLHTHESSGLGFSSYAKDPSAASDSDGGDSNEKPWMDLRKVKPPPLSPEDGLPCISVLFLEQGSIASAASSQVSF